MSKLLNLVNKFIDFMSKYLILILAYLFICIPMFLICLEFAAFGKDHTNIINLIFAVILGLAAVCFTYSRSYDSEKKETCKLILRCGQRFLLAALIFLISSAFEYTKFAMTPGPKDNPTPVFAVLAKISGMVSFVLFFIALTNTAVPIFIMLYHLKEEITNSDK